MNDIINMFLGTSSSEDMSPIGKPRGTADQGWCNDHNLCP